MDSESHQQAAMSGLLEYYWALDYSICDEVPQATRTRGIRAYRAQATMPPSPSAVTTSTFRKSI